MPRAVWLSRADPFASRQSFAAACAAGAMPPVGLMAAWEVDYLFMLFPEARWRWVSSAAAIAALEPDLVVLMSNDFSVESVVSGRAPKVLVILSDEWGRMPDTHRHTQDVALVLRQHGFAHYVQAPNVRQIPLGFMATMFGGSAPPPPPRSARRLIWSFVGSIKGERSQALGAFADWGPHWYGACTPRDMARVYSDSVFVLCPRGNVRMDCFRNYEATVCGAIPVVAGCSKAEYEETFGGIGSPPWVFCETWDEALIRCQALLASGAVEALRQQNLEWWSGEVAAIRAAFAAALARDTKTAR